MASLNMVQLIGNLGKDPEIRSMNSGDRVANFSMAMGEKWKDKSSGDMKEKTEWVNVVVWGNGLVDVIEKYVHKGDTIYVQGQIKTRKYEKDGSDRYTTEVVIQGFGGKVVLLGGKSGGDRSDSNSGSDASDYRGATTGASDSKIDYGIDDDSIPF